MLGKGKKWNVKLMQQKDEAYFRVQIFLIKKKWIKISALNFLAMWHWMNYHFFSLIRGYIKNN